MEILNTNKEEIIRLEKELLESSTRKSTKRLDELIADDFVEFGSSGKIYQKTDILLHLPEEGKRYFEVLDIETRQLGTDSVLITYRIKERHTTSIRSSIWCKNLNGWQMVFHQGTTAANSN